MAHNIQSTTNNASTNFFTLIFSEDKIKNKESVVRIFAEVFGVSLVDARIVVKNLRGFINRPMESEKAKNLQERLKDLKINSQIVMLSQIPFLPPPKDSIEISFQEDAISIKTKSQKIEEIKLCNIICAVSGFVFLDPLSFYTSDYFLSLPILSKVDDKESRKMLKEKIVCRADEKDLTGFNNTAMSIQDILNKKDSFGKLFCVLDLIAIDPPRRIRLSSLDFMSYASILPEISNNNITNFKMLTKFIIEKLPPGCDSVNAKNILNTSKPISDAFDSLEQFDNYLRWHLYNSHKNLPQDFFDAKITKFKMSEDKEMLSTSKDEIKKRKRFSLKVISAFFILSFLVLSGIGYWVYNTHTKKILRKIELKEKMKREAQLLLDKAKEVFNTNKYEADDLLDKALRRNNNLYEACLLKNKIHRVLFMNSEPRPLFSNEEGVSSIYNASFENRTNLENLMFMEYDLSKIYFDPQTKPDRRKNLQKILPEMCLELTLSFAYLKDKERMNDYYSKLKMILDDAEGNTYFMIATGYKFLVEEDYIASEKVFTSIPKEKMTSDSRMGLAQVYYKLNDIDKAIELLLELIKIEPDQPEAFIRLAEFYLEKKDYETAKKYAKEVLDKYSHFSGIEEFRKIFVALKLIEGEENEQNE